MSSNGIKTEDGAFIKPEHEADEYEDTGECHMPANPEEQRAWLCRLPKWLWTAWEDMADDEEIELGKIRVYHQGIKKTEARRNGGIYFQAWKMAVSTATGTRG